jgi:hypothetical protein
VIVSVQAHAVARICTDTIMGRRRPCGLVDAGGTIPMIHPDLSVQGHAMVQPS